MLLLGCQYCRTWKCHIATSVTMCSGNWAYVAASWGMWAELLELLVGIGGGCLLPLWEDPRVFSLEIGVPKVLGREAVALGLRHGSRCEGVSMVAVQRLGPPKGTLAFSAEKLMYTWNFVTSWTLSRIFNARLINWQWLWIVSYIVLFNQWNHLFDLL